MRVLIRWGVAVGMCGLGLLAPTTVGASARLEGVPQYDHVVVLIEENESFASTFGTGSPATYLNNTLVPMSTMDDQYFATGHASLDNYIALTSGQPILPETAADCGGLSLFVCVQPQALFSGGRNLGDQVETAGLSWKQYSDGTTQPCVHAPYDPTSPAADSFQGDGGTPTAGTGAGPNYADRHNGFLYYPDIIGNDARCRAHLVPFTQMASDIAANNLPAFSFITPDTCNDGHDDPCKDGAGHTSPGGLVSADAWLHGPGNVAGLIRYLKSHRGLLILTFDEGSSSDLGGCCAGGPLGTSGHGGRVGLLAFGRDVQAGRLIHTAYDHASLLRTVEDALGISEHINNAGSSVPMTDLFVDQGDAGPTATSEKSAQLGAGTVLPFTSSATGTTGLPAALSALLLAIAALVLGYRARKHATRPDQSPSPR